MTLCKYDSRNYKNCGSFSKINGFDPYGLVCIHRDSLGMCKDKYAPIRQLTKKDRDEIHAFALKRSAEMMDEE